MPLLVRCPGVGRKASAFFATHINIHRTDEGISGAELVELHHADLKDMGIDSFGHRLTILKSVYEVKVKQNVPLDEDHFIPLCQSYHSPHPGRLLTQT